jgi:hypothetical protein
MEIELRATRSDNSRHSLDADEAWWCVFGSGCMGGGHGEHPLGGTVMGAAKCVGNGA